MMTETRAQTVEIIAIDRIDVVNPRVRNKRSFKDMTANIGEVGLKKPITVSRRNGPDGVRYELICGQGRLEAYIALGQSEIPAFVTEADGEDCLLQSLVENCARRKHNAIDLLHDIEGLKRRGYSEPEIAKKTGLTYQYVKEVLRLLEKGEQRLLQAVEAGHIPITVAAEIAEADDEGVQQALQQAYEKKLLRGRKLLIVKRLIEQRRRRGKGLSRFKPKREGVPTTHALVRTYNEDADRKRHLIRKAGSTRDKLIFVAEALRNLFEDENFLTLLRAEGLDTLPRNLSARMQRTGAVMS